MKRSNSREEKIKNIMSEDATTNFETSKTGKRRRYIRRSDNPTETEAKSEDVELLDKEEETTQSFLNSSDEDDSNLNENENDNDNTNTEKVKTMRRRSDNRQILVLLDKESGNLKGMFLDAGHAAHVLGLSVKDIKTDLIKGTSLTEKKSNRPESFPAHPLWLKVPAGKSLADSEEIKKNTKIAFKEWKATGGIVEKKKPGRKPAKTDPNELTQVLKSLKLEQLDDKTLRKLKSLLTPKQQKAVAEAK